MKVGYKICEKYMEDFEASILFQKGIIFVWIKNGCSEGVTILNEGCIHIIPD